LDASPDAERTVTQLLSKGDNCVLSTPDPVMTTEDMFTFMETAKDCLGQRFLLVLDCYRSHDQTELVLNTAYRV